MKILKKIIFAIFCPIYLAFEHNASERVSQTKFTFVKYIFLAVVIAAAMTFAYYLKEIL